MMYVSYTMSLCESEIEGKVLIVSVSC
jgi:hypothetical protein